MLQGEHPCTLTYTISNKTVTNNTCSVDVNVTNSGPSTLHEVHALYSLFYRNADNGRQGRALPKQQSANR